MKAKHAIPFLFLLLALLPAIVKSHPGIGIVKDSKGNIYYTDLKQVWKISNGVKSVIVPDAHTHELYIDGNDNLFGEGGYYEDKADKFYHYLWVYHQNGKIDTVIGMKQAYVEQDFSLTRDKNGNEYYVKRYVVPPDTNHIYRKTPAGKEMIVVTGNFRHVTWLHVSDDGSLLYVLNNAIYRIDNGKTRLVKSQIGNAKPSFALSGNNITIWGVWSHKENIYAAAFSDQAVKRISPGGKISVVYQSRGNWAPIHGLLDNDDRLWVLESSDKNEVRVTLAGNMTGSFSTARSNRLPLVAIGGLLAVGFMAYAVVHRRNEKMRRHTSAG